MATERNQPPRDNNDAATNDNQACPFLGDSRGDGKRMGRGAVQPGGGCGGEKGYQSSPGSDSVGTVGEGGRAIAAKQENKVRKPVFLDPHLWEWLEEMRAIHSLKSISVFLNLLLDKIKQDNE